MRALDPAGKIGAAAGVVIRFQRHPLARVLTWAALAVTFCAPVLNFTIVDPIFTAPNTFEDGYGYLLSAERLLETGTPYQDWQVTAPYGAVTPSDTYRYPPPFAQAAAIFVLTGTGWIFVGILVGTCFLAPLVLARSRRQAALALWLGVAFLPSWIAAWEAQVTGLLAIAVAVALRERPVGILVGAALKVTPILAMPAAIAGLPRATVAAALVLAPLLALSIVLSPLAWAQVAAVLLNQFLGGSDHPSLAPTGGARLVTLAVVAVLLVLSVVLGRRSWPLALYVAVVAGLLLPGFFPKYNLPILLPFLFVGLDDPRARRWSVAAFVPLAYPFISFSAPVFLGLILLGVAMWKLKGPGDPRSGSGGSVLPFDRTPDGSLSSA